MRSKPEADFLRGNAPLVLTVLVGVSRFAGYVEGARNAGNVARSGDAVRQAVKWDIDSVEGGTLIRKNLLGALLQALQALDARTERLEEIAEVAADLHRKTDYSSAFTSSRHAEQWTNDAIPKDLQAVASRLACLLEALIAEIMGSESPS